MKAAVCGMAFAACLLGCSHPAAPDSAPEAKPEVEVSLARVQLGDISSSITVTGALSPLPNEEAKIAPLAAGRIKSIFVKVGDVVRKGQLVALLDPTTSSGQVQQAQGAVRVAQATLLQAKTNVLVQSRTQNAAVEQARLNLEAQRLALTRLRNGSRPQEIAQAQSAVASAQAALLNSQQSLARSQTLYSQGLIARKDLEAAQTQELTARSSLASAQQALSLARQGNRPEDIRAGEVAVTQAEQQLRAAQSQAIQTSSKQQDVRIAQGQLQAAQGALRSALAQSRSLSVYAPVAGTVVARTVNPGESVDVTTPIATIVNLDRLRLLLNVPPSASRGLSLGQPVEFATDADPARKLSAHVTVINKAVDPATNSVQVEALVDNSSHDLRDDALVKARVFTTVHRGVLLVPLSAVIEKDGKATVFVAGTDDAAHAKEVQVGSQDTSHAEILSGLRVGDRVVTTGAFELDDGTKIKVAK